jgi:signal transduction histidine kinase/CheY-like chemotaxis protein
MSDDDMRFDPARVAQLLASLEELAGGELDHTVAISPAHDSLDALAFGINVLVEELRYTSDGLRRARDVAESANLAKTAFLRNISHEIRTPLSAIIGLGDVLALEELDAARRHDVVGRIQTNARALLGLVDDLLDLSKVEAGKLQFEVAPMVLIDVVAEVVRSLEPEALRKSVELTIESLPGTPAAIDSDARRVRQILMNVIGNALKFTERGEIRVRLELCDERRLAIDVIDTGIGLTVEQQRELFVPFQQADPTIARVYGGSGLGLMLSKRFAEALGGELVILTSRPGVGTTFRLTLPARRGEEMRAPRPPTAAPRPRPSRPLAGLRVALAEDNHDIRTALAELLQVAGAEVALAADGHEAVRQALEVGFDVLLMDVRMPGLDGLEATRLLRQRGYARPIVALTADAMKEHRAECLAAGYDDYIAKPIEYPQLVEIVLRATR